METGGTANVYGLSVSGGHAVVAAEDGLRIYAITSEIRVSVSEAQPEVTIIVPRTSGAAGAGSLSYRTVDGSAVAGQDYQAAQGELAFAAGQTNGTMSIPLLNDGRPEPTESFEVELSDNPPGSILIPDWPVPGRRDYSGQRPRFRPRAASVTVGEAAGEVVLTVRRPERRARCRDGGIHDRGRDRQGRRRLHGRLRHADLRHGGTSQEIRVPILKDAIVECDEDFSVRLSGATGAGWLGINAQAQVTIKGDADEPPFTYTTDLDTITITRYTGPGGAVDIPGNINCLPVTSIGTNAFGGCSTLTSVTIPNTVGTVGSHAFSGCSGLTNVTLPTASRASRTMRSVAAAV